MIGGAMKPVKQLKKSKKLTKRKQIDKTSIDYSSDSSNEEQVHAMVDERVSDDSDRDNNSPVDEESKEIKKSAIQLGFANAFAKVMKQEKPKNKKHVFLSKSKKINDQLEEKEQKLDFEIDGEIKEEKPIKTELDLDIEMKSSDRKNKAVTLRMKPSLMDREREKAFKKIATKGVVQLFNAVRVQQKDLTKKLDEVGPLDHRKDAVLNNINKKKFLDVLMGGNRAKSELVDNPVKDESREESANDADYTETDRPDPTSSQWSVLRNDFMTNKKMTNWDKDEDSDGEDNAMDTDNDSDTE
ncbi:RRP15-like protein [Pseudolycoriella hygida]|uniref:RRP15-like protein n=1 Tax=Pseudolycoriella hygida TaxID=35572 RepID=A0A9Q0MNS5_9DIPT|nr:RRP15-like protein [Pseudolycoriella hygida]